MTYRSNPFDKQDYSKFAFKKSELLAVIQAIDENFSFDLVNADLQENKELLHIEANTNVNHEYKLFLFKKPLLSFHEAACIMTGYDPQYVEQCQNDTNFKQNFSNYLGAYDYISTCIDAQMLSYDSYSNRLCASEFKQFLANENIIIAGFNDHLKNEPIDQSLDNQDSITDKLKKENEELRARIAELESWQDNTTEPIELNGIHAINQHKSDLQGMARVIAAKKWLEDDTVLIGAMADTVYREVARYTADMPDTTDTVKNWIRSVAPKSAQKRGRPPNKN